MAFPLRLSLDKRGVDNAALTSPEVRGRLRQVAEATAARARSRTSLEIEVVEGGTHRARFYVTMLGAQSAREESLHRILGRSLTNGG